jgi:hypothetical protein
MNVALFLLAIPISIADIKSFVIPNIYNKILLYVALIHLSFYGFGDLCDVLISVVILIVLAILRTGMGDIKTLSLILMTHTAGAVEFIGVVFFLAIVHIVVLTGFHKEIPSKIPLAPSIFLGLATYLATS